MNTNKIDLIKAEVARLKSHLIKGACASQIAMETRCKEEAYNEVLAILYSLQEESKFKTGDRIKPIDSCLGSPRTIVDICDSWYVTDQGTLDFEYEDNWELVEEPAGLDKGKLMDMLENSLSKETKDSWNKRIDEDEEPVNEELEEACEQLAENARKHKAETSSPFFSQGDYKQGVIDGTKWQKKHNWKPADGDDLPEIDREVIALLDNGKVVFAHRPPEYWDGKDIVTGKVTRNYPKTYDKGGWNIPDIKCWLDVELPKEIEL